MKIDKRIILIFSISFILLIGLTTISATDNTTVTTNTQNNNIQTDNPTITHTTNTITKNTTQTVTNDNTKTDNIKESSVNTNNNIKTTSTSRTKTVDNTQTNTKQKDTIDQNNNQNNNQNTNIQTTTTVNKLDNNNQETTPKTNTIKTTTNLKQANDDTDTIYINASYSGSSDGTKAKPYTDVNTGFTTALRDSKYTNVYIADGTYNLTNTITINKNLNITGESTTGTIISGQNGKNTYTQIMKIDYEYKVNITNITFTNGKEIRGGAINNQGILTVTNASFINNTATSTASGSPAYAYGGAIYNNNHATSTVTGSSFINNTATTTTGESSSAEVYGGAIYNYYATSTITASSFINNTATTTTGESSSAEVYGGAIYNYYATFTITGSSFINNTATTTIGESSSAEVYGGAIYNFLTTLTAQYNIFLNNTDSNNYEIYNTGSNVNSLDYNWWGQNTTNYQNSPNTLGLTNYGLNNWLYLNITTLNNKWVINTPEKLILNLTRYYTFAGTTSTLTDTDVQKLPQNIPVTYTTNQGIITDNTLLINGISTATYTPTTTQTVTVTSTIYTNSTTLTKEVTQLDTVYVNASATTIGTGESWNSPVITIQDALDRVSDGGKIILAEGTYNTAGDYALTIAQNVNITGQKQDKVIIDGQKTNQIMTINNGYAVNITNITFTNGKAQDNGGAINNQGTLTVTNASFINNTATTTGKMGSAYAHGGAIYNDNYATSTVTGSNFINNTATSTATGETSLAYATGGAIYNDNYATSTVTGSSFINNTVRATSTATRYMSSAYARGGAIYNFYGTSTVTGSSFINNTVRATSTATGEMGSADAGGGAIYNYYVTSTITNSSFINNIATGEGTYINAFGGAIDNVGTLTAQYNIFLNNTDSNNYEIYNDDGTVNSLDYNWWGQNTTNYQNSPDNNDLKLTNYNGDKLTKWLYLNITSQDTWTVGNPVTLITNLTGYYSSTGTTGTLTIEEAQLLPQNIPVTYTTTPDTITFTTQDKTLTNGIATATYTPTTTQTVTVTSTIYTNSTTLTKEVTQLDTVYVNASATTIGTGESWNSPVITIQDALDRVSDGGKIIIAEGTYNIAGDYALTIAQNVNITGQTKDKVIIDGQKTNQILTVNNGFTVNITNITFTNGQANNGGAIYNNGTLTITNSSFINNTATSTGKGSSSMVLGGAIYNNGTLTVTNANFINNTATGEISTAYAYGGAIYNNNANFTVTGSSFINNTATTTGELRSVIAYGGAIENVNANSTIIGSSFINNTATATTTKGVAYAYGGAIDTFLGTSIIIGSSFINNTATVTGTSGPAQGGAIYNFLTTLTVQYNIFLNNTDSNNYEIDNEEGTITSLDYNWWGQNTTNYQNSPYTLGLTNYKGDQLTKWIYLNMTTSTNTWNIGNPVTLTTNLTGYYENTTSTTGTLTTEEVEKLPQNIPVTYTTNQGTITDNTLLINGIATATYTSVISGENTITANIYTNNTSITKTATKIDTSITMKNINGTTKENITITAIITSNGNTINTGTVTFIDTNGLTKTVDVINGIATTNISYNKPGNYTITANYNENNMYSSSQTTATATIKTRDVNMNITITPTTTTANTTFNMTIKDIDGNNVTDGTIYFYNNNTLLGNTTVTNGTANYNYTFNKAGNYNITAVYNSTLYNSVNKTVNFTITKSDTKIVVNPINGTVQNTIKLQANVTDQYGNNVIDGKVVFKINGTTIKDSKGNVIYAQVTNGIATLQYIIPNSLTKDNLTIQAIYSGTDDTYNPSRNNNTINVNKRTADINLIITKNPVKATDTVTFMTLIHDTNGTIINNGIVIFKFNGKTIKDNKGNTIKVNIINGQAKLEYTIPNGISAKTYNITAIYANNDYNRAETNTPLTTEKIQSTIILQPTTTTRGSNTTLLTGIIKDTNGNLMVGTHKIAIKLNGKNIGTYTTTNGIINTNITIPNTLKNTNYIITIKIGDTNGYYGTNTTTTLTINSTKIS